MACDSGSGKIYTANSEPPLTIWSLDVSTGVYSVLIDVQSRPEWTSKITEIQGMTYDPIGKHLYVLAGGEKLILQSAMNGTLIGAPLNLSAVEDPNDVTFEPTTGDLIVIGEPAQVARYSKRPPTASPTKAPTSAPVKAPTKAPVKAPVKGPTKAPTKAGAAGKATLRHYSSNHTSVKFQRPSSWKKTS